MAKTVNPTRMELLKTKQRMKLADKGHKLLKKKRDALIMKLFDAAKKMGNIRVKLSENINHGYNALIKSCAIGGSVEVKSIADATPEMPEIGLKLVNVSGVRIPQITLKEEKKNKINYGLTFTSSLTDTALEQFEETKKGIIKLIETEETIKRLSNEINKTKRRVNALEYIMIPELKKTEREIKAKLEEIERENFFRLKIVKKKQGK